MRRNKRGIVSIRHLYSVLFVGICFIAVGLGVLPAAAVDKGKTSYTAEAVCAFRSICALDPDPKTRNPDHMAQSFINPGFEAQFPGLGLAYEDAKIAADVMNTGVLYWINARTHHLDVKLKEALEAGFDQVVIMGAGFDSRAYRFHDAYPKVRFFEIDLPATSDDKQKRVEKIIGSRPDWVTYIPIDFNTQSLGDVLAKADFDSAQKTFYIWEGVTYYISRAGVEGTLRFVAERSAPGSQIVFDYMLEAVVQGSDYSPHGAKYTVFMIANMGEPYIFGPDPSYLKSFANGLGLSLLSDVGPSDLTRRYLIHSNGTVSGKMAAFLRIVHAQVPSPDQRPRLRENAEARMAAGIKQPHQRAQVPDGVQKLLTSAARNLKRKDFTAMAKDHSANYLEFGRTWEQIAPLLQQIYKRRPIDVFDFVITRFDQQGDKAKIDGYVQRKGFRTPLMINDIIKEEDGQWRWHGNQKR